MLLQEDFVFFSGKSEFKQRYFKKVRTVIPAQAASVSPPLGPVLGQLGINIIEFCKQFNDKSKNYKKNVLLNVIIFVYKDKSFFFFIKPPSVSFLFYEFFSDLQNEDIFPTKIPLSFFYKVILHRSLLNGIKDKKEIASSVRGSLRSMHLKIYDDLFTGKKYRKRS
jgi:large subunit ribosomal protein L11